MRWLPTDLPSRFREPRPWDWLRPAFVRVNDEFFLRRSYRVRAVEDHGWERVRELAEAGHAVLLAPNHSDHSDPHVVTHVGARHGLRLRFMAARELFDVGGVQAWALQRMGVFSVDRDGPDLAAVKTAIDILTTGGCPLVIYPEGEVYLHADRLDPLHEGVASILLRAAARLEAPKEAWLVPVAIRFRHDPEVEATFAERLSRLEDRIGWKPRPVMPMQDRILRLGAGVLALKEVEYLGQVGVGTLPERLVAMCQKLLADVESRRGRDARASTPPERVRALRYRIRRRLLDEQQPPGEEERRGLLEDLDRVFTALQAHSYPGDYLLEDPGLDRRAETVMKLEEDLLGACRYETPRTARVTAGVPLNVSAQLREGTLTAKSGAAPLTGMLEQRLVEMLAAGR
jgi:1-acyl-sn-glycerol-3-phosphate acyltransferase